MMAAREIARTSNVRMSRKMFTWKVAGGFCAAVRGGWQ